MNENAPHKAPRVTSSLIFSLPDLPLEGVKVESVVPFSELYDAAEVKDIEERVRECFSHPIQIQAHVLPVGSKVDIRGEFQTQISGQCDRCSRDTVETFQDSFSTFLMPRSQFSEHDKPGGKVIHPPTRGGKSSRHHSRSKAPILSDAEGEHEDINFGAFDGERVDLRKILRELLILQIPMSTLCRANCHGLCLRCGENVDDERCRCSEGPLLVGQDQPELETPRAGKPLSQSISPLAQALQSRLAKS